MLDEKDFEYCYDTLSGILNWIQQREHATEGQKRAVDNILAKTKRID